MAENESVYVDGHFTNLEALARKIQAGIIAVGGIVETDEDAITSALAGFDMSAHITDTMNEESLGQFLDEFEAAWLKVAGTGEVEE